MPEEEPSDGVATANLNKGMMTSRALGCLREEPEQNWLRQKWGIV
jgi:hypothetical protein